MLFFFAADTTIAGSAEVSCRCDCTDKGAQARTSPREKQQENERGGDKKGRPPPLGVCGFFPQEPWGFKYFVQQMIVNEKRGLSNL